MLKLAQKKTSSSSRVKWIEADALQLPFSDQSFDLITSAFGFRNLADYDAGFREIWRVLKPGAEFGIGMVKSVRLKEGVAYLEFSNDAPVPAGSVIRAYHEYAISGKTPICDLEVVRVEGGLAVAIARPGSELINLAVGDRALVLR